MTIVANNDSVLSQVTFITITTNKLFDYLVANKVLRFTLKCYVNDT
jgi:hypothetical protein